MEDKTMEIEIWDTMQRLHQQLQMAKPQERNEIARRYAVTTTEFEKVMAYFDLWVYRNLKTTEGQ